MSAQTNDPTIDVSSPYTPRRPAPIVSVSINHPIGTLLRKIKNFLTHKQTLFATSFTIKVTPIVAIVSLFGLAALFGGGVTTAFNIGKTVEQKFLAALPSPTPVVVVQNTNLVTVSKAGTIKATYQNPLTSSGSSIPSPTSVILNGSEGSQSANNQPSPTPAAQPILHYILVSKSGSINYLSASSTINFQKYLNIRVLVTGSFDSGKNTLNVSKSSDIEVLQ